MGQSCLLPCVHFKTIFKLTILIFPDLELILEATITILLHQLRPHFSPQYAKRCSFFTFCHLQWIDFIMSWMKAVSHYTFFLDVFWNQKTSLEKINLLTVKIVSESNNKNQGQTICYAGPSCRLQHPYTLHTHRDTDVRTAVSLKTALLLSGKWYSIKNEFFHLVFP